MQLTKRVLKHQTKEVDFKYPVQNKNLADELLETMHREGGCGLAANQVGVKKSVFAVYVEECSLQRVFFNPKIVSTEADTEIINEGCLSFPGEYCEISRPTSIRLHWQDYTGEHFEEDFTGMAARVIQHELDHLRGLTMFDRISINQQQKEAL